MVTEIERRRRNWHLELKVPRQRFRVITDHSRKKKTIQYVWGDQWLEIWKIEVYVNKGDLALNIDTERRHITLVKRDEPPPSGVNRYVTDNDICFFHLENGRTIVMEKTPEISEIIGDLEDYVTVKQIQDHERSK